MSDGSAVLTVTEYSYDRRGLLVCTAVRMNPSNWSTPLPDKCVPGPADPVNGFDRITKNLYDAAGRLVETWDGVGTPLQRREALYTYNRNDQKTSLTDARGFRAEMTYDGHGRQQRWIFPSKTTPGFADQADYEQYGYDAAGNRVSLRKRDGRVLSFDYDALNRVVIKYVPEGAIRYSYDLRGLQTAAWFTGTGWGISNAWDGFGRLSSTTSNMGGFSRTVSHQYDREGRRIELTFPDGRKFWTARDGLGRATEDYQGAHGSTAHIMTAFAYDASGRRSHFARRFGDNSSYGYDAAGRLNSQVDLFPGGTGNSQSSYVHNPASQLHTESRTNDAYAWTGSVAVSRPYSVNGQNQYTAAGAATFTYDANGNLTSTTNAPWSTSYAYDSENRLVSATGTHNATLVYDPLGRLFQISSASGTTQFLYDGDELVAEYNGAGTVLRRHIHGDGADDPLYWFEGAGLDQPRFPHVNHQGSVTAVAGPGSALLAINAYDEYGIPRDVQTGAAALSSHGRFQYTGQAWIPELGLYYYKARFYSPYMGRFLQVDPIGYDDQINLYAYVGNDPINFSDPSGKCSSVADGKSRADCVTSRANAVEGAKEYLSTQSVRSGQTEAAYIATYNASSGEVSVRTGDAAGVRTNTEVAFKDNKGAPLSARPDGRIVERIAGKDRATEEIVLVTGHGHPKDNPGGRGAARSLDRANDNIRSNRNDKNLSKVAPAVIKGTSGTIKVYVNGKEVK